MRGVTAAVCNLDRLNKIDLRKVLSNEALCFTKSLSVEINLNTPGNEVGIGRRPSSLAGFETERAQLSYWTKYREVAQASFEFLKVLNPQLPRIPGRRCAAKRRSAVLQDQVQSRCLAGIHRSAAGMVFRDEGG